MSIEHIAPMPTFHRIVKHNGTAYLSGIVANDGNAAIDVQVNRVIDKLASILAIPICWRLPPLPPVSH